MEINFGGTKACMENEHCICKPKKLSLFKLQEPGEFRGRL